MHNTPLRFSRLKAFLHSCFVWDKPFFRNILLLSLPMILQDLTGATLHIVDGLMVSGLGDAAYSGVMQANRFTFVFQLFLFGIVSGSAIFFSQHWGVRDISRMRHAMGLAIGVAVPLAALFSLAGIFLPQQIVGFFLPQGDSFELAVQYLRAVAPSYVLVALGNVYAASLKAAEKTYIPMLAGISGLLTNTILNYGLIYGNMGLPALGVEGAAIATVVSAIVSLSINLAFSYGKRLPAGAPLREMLCRDRTFVRKFFKTVLPVIFNEGLWGLGAVMYSVFYGTMGDESIAAIGVNTTLSDLVWVFGMAITNASAIMIGKTLGQGDRVHAYLYSKRLMAGGAALGLVLGFVFLMLRMPLVALFSGLSQAARDKAQLLLVVNSAFLWLRTMNCINVVGLLRSGGDTVYSLVLDAGTMWLIGVPLTGIAALLLHWPIEYVYVCTLADELCKLFIGLPHFKSKKWMHILTERKKESELIANP